MLISIHDCLLSAALQLKTYEVSLQGYKTRKCKAELMIILKFISFWRTSNIDITGIAVTSVDWRAGIYTTSYAPRRIRWTEVQTPVTGGKT